MKYSLLSCCLPLLPGTLIFSAPGLAQIIPDATLGSERSVVTPLDAQTDRIDGGALRDAALFHSFEQFGILEGRGAYFANPVEVNIIFSRITGENPSDIFGTLGVLGEADLVFLNPNGILFGPNAELDLRGSFTATTADTVELADGETFGVLQPEVPSLLNVNVEAPIGLRFESTEQGLISSEANLSIEDDLTLASNNLNLQGQLFSGGDLTLQGQDTVTIRDSENNSFIAAAGNQLTVQGNQSVDILALNHPDSGLFSIGDLVLQSANMVSGDAHFFAGNDFRIEQLDGSLGDLFSPYDPVIRASGDVSFDSYQGASLHILAGGSVSISGDVRITGADTTGNAINPVDNPDIATITGADGQPIIVNHKPAILDNKLQIIDGEVQYADGEALVIDGTAQPTLDIRAGTTAYQIGSSNNIENQPGSNSNRADITIEGDIVNLGGLVFLSNQFMPNDLQQGDIEINNVDTSGSNIVQTSGMDIIETALGGDVILDSRSNIFVNGSVSTEADSDIFQEQIGVSIGNLSSTAIGGDIYLGAVDSVITQVLDSSASAEVTARSEAGTVSNLNALSIGGDIAIRAGVTITNIRLEDPDPNLLFPPKVTEIISRASSQVRASVNEDLDDSNTDLIAQAGSIGNIDVVVIGGEIDFQAEGKITTDDIDSFAGLVRDIRLSARATNGSNSLAGNIGDLSITTSSGNIFLQSGEDLTTGSLDARTQIDDVEVVSSASPISGGLAEAGVIEDVSAAAWGGDISLISGGDLFADFLSSNADSELYVISFVQPTDNFSTIGNISTSGRIGDVETLAIGGNIYIDAGGEQSTVDVIDSFADASTGVDALRASSLGEIGNVSSIAEGGNIYINVAGDLRTRALNSYADAARPDGDSLFNTGADGAGNIVGNVRAVARAGDIELNAQNVVSNDEAIDANATAFADNIGIEGISPQFTREVLATAQGGNIVLTTQKSNVSLENTVVDSSASATSNNLSDIIGNVNEISSGGSISIDLMGNISLSDVELRSNVLQGDGDGGDIRLSADSISLFDSNISSDVVGQGRSGGIFFSAIESILLDRSRVTANLESEAQSDQETKGDIEIFADSLELRNFSLLNTTSFGTGNAGDISISAEDSILLNDSSLFSLSAGSEGNSGNVNLNSGSVIKVIGNSVISTALGLGTVGKGGNIILQAPEEITISGIGFIPELDNLPTSPTGSDIFENEPNDPADSAQSVENFIRLDISGRTNPDVQFSDEIPYVSIAALSGDRSADYYSFDITQAGTQVTFDIDNVETDDTQETLDTTLELIDRRFEIDEFGETFIQEDIIAENNDASEILGAAGSLDSKDAYLTYVFNEPGTYFIKVGEFDQLRNAPRRLRTEGSYELQVSRVENFLVNSGISAQSRGNGAGGNIFVNTSQLNLENGGQIAVSADGIANAGNIDLSPFGSDTNLTINLENSEITGTTLGSGQGGKINIQAPEAVILSGSGEISSEVSGNGIGGAINIKVPFLTIASGLQVSTNANDSADSSAQGGNLTVTADSIEFLDEGSGLFAETVGDASAGDITLLPGDSGKLAITSLFGGAQISASTSGEGAGGNINVRDAGVVTIDNTGLATNTSGGGLAGSIFVENVGTLSLRNGSLLLADAGGNADGGNIAFDGDIIFAVPQENSGITANAVSGSGGQVTINAQQLIGIEFRPALTPFSDITASSEEGPQGTVTIDTLDVDPTQGLATLPQEPRAPEIIQGCRVSGNREATQFFDAGRGGTRPNPDDLVILDTAGIDWVSLELVEHASPNSDISFSESVSVSDRSVGQLITSCQRREP